MADGRELAYVRELLEDIYTPDGVQVWLASPLQRLGGERPIDLINEGRVEEVVAVIAQMREGTM